MSKGGQGGNGANAEPAPDGGDPEKTVVIDDRRRPWLLPAIFSGVLILLLILLLIPGVLLYPEQTEQFSDDQMLEMQRDTNSALEDRVRELQDLSNDPACGC